MDISKQSIYLDEKRDSTNLLYSHVKAGLLISIVTASVLVFGFKTIDVQQLKYGWWVLFAVWLSIRLADIVYWEKKLSSSQFNNPWPRRRFIAGALVTAVFWSAYGFMITQHSDIIELSYTLTIIAGMAGGSATILAGSKIAAVGYSTILLLPLSVYLVFYNEIYHQLIGGLGIVFNLVMIISAKRTADFTRKAIQLKNHNRILVEQMRLEKNEVSRVNDELNRAYKEIHKSNHFLEKEVVKRTRQIYKLSNLDPLTQLYNRNPLIQALNQLLERVNQENISLAVLFIDLNGFKQINDTLGHKVGDGVLKIISARIAKFKQNGNVGRWGGDEFILLLPHCNQEKAVAQAKKMMQSIAATINIGPLSLNITASIGISLSPDHSHQEHQLIQYADVAMYKQKKSRKNTPCVFSNKLLKVLQKSEKLRIGLRQAITNNEFFLVYQPILDFDNNLMGCEALLRWSFNQQLITPNQFIEIAEQSGLIIEIGRWVLQQACTDAKQWSHIKNHKVSVNVSINQLLDKHFLTDLKMVLAKSELPPKALMLEIAESSFAKNEIYIRNLFIKIKSLGVGISIDDFGAKCSSFPQLKELHFDIIKIDQVYINKLHDYGRSIVKTALFMAKELGCKTVAEGVESKEQLETLKTLGADYLQGFLYEKPMKMPVLLQYIGKSSKSLLLS